MPAAQSPCDSPYGIFENIGAVSRKLGIAVPSDEMLCSLWCGTSGPEKASANMYNRLAEGCLALLIPSQSPEARHGCPWLLTEHYGSLCTPTTQHAKLSLGKRPATALSCLSYRSMWSKTGSPYNFTAKPCKVSTLSRTALQALANMFKTLARASVDDHLQDYRCTA